MFKVTPADFPPTEPIRWIYAQRIDGGEWIRRFISTSEKCPSLDNSRMMDETQIGEMRRSEFAIFKAGDGWQDRKPRRYLDLRDKTNAPIGSHVSGLLNSLESDWF